MANIVCPDCLATNRVPEARLNEAPRCGRCHEPLFRGKPIEVSENAFRRIVEHTTLPVIVDFHADWCGPCKAFAPVFEAAAANLEPRVRLLGVDVDANQTLAQQLQVRSIPTLAIFRDGREVTRQAGAMSAAQFTAWVSQHT